MRNWIQRSKFMALAGASLLAATGLADSIDILEQPLPGALKEFSDKTGLQLAYVATLAQGKTSPGTQGRSDTDAALSDLLEGTELRYQYVNPATVAIGSARAGAGRARQAPRGANAAPKSVFMANLQQSSQAVEGSAEEGSDEQGEMEEPKEEEALELDEQRVTGSRMKGGDPTTRVISFSAEDIARRGISSTEDIFRDLPWAFGSNTTQSSVDFDGPPDVGYRLGVFGLGTSSVNLRAMGADNTLVLINGRRLAGRGGYASDVVNLMNIPLSAIERVDIELGAASAIYGADAVGGVVNFITRKRYAGMEATVRQEYSATDADRRTMSVRGGYAWLNGSMTANVSRTESGPINNLKIWTSNDFTDRFGPEYDLRHYSYGQPGVVCTHLGGYSWSYRYPRCNRRQPTLQLRPGHSGIGATADDFTTEIAPFDYVTPYNGEDSTNLSLNVRAEQYLGDDLMIYGEAVYSDHDAFREMPTLLYGYLIGAGNAYNPFGKDMVVNYIPLREMESGLFPPRTVETQNRQRTYNAGMIWKIGAGHELDLSLTRSHTRFSGLHSKHDYRRDEEDPSATDFYRALESSDPRVALNPFGDGSAQGSDFSQFLYPYSHARGETELKTLEAVLRGNLFEIWGGPVSYVLGGERREREIFRAAIEYIIAGTRESNHWGDRGYDTSRPQVELEAGFMELGFPLVGEPNSRPGLRALYLSLQARYDNYTFEGPAGGVDDPWVFHEDAYRNWVPGMGWTSEAAQRLTEFGTANLIQKQKSDTSPRIGLQYKPTDSLAIRTAWTQSFHPPGLTQQFGYLEPGGGNEFFTDPLHPSGEPTRIIVRHIQATYNPELRSEYADKYSLSLDWEPVAAPGLRWTVDWSRIEFTDKIEHPSLIRRLYPLTYAGNPDLVRRDDSGNVINLYSHQINLSSKVSELLETSLQYAFDTNFGTFAPRLTYARLLNEYYQLVGAADPIDRVSTAHGSDRYVLNGQLTWLWRKFAADLFVYYRPGYLNDSTGRCGKVVGRCERLYQDRPELELGSFTKIDLTLTYQFDNGLRFRTGGRNLLKREAPTIYGSYGYDIVRWDARSRVLFLELHWAM